MKRKITVSCLLFLLLTACTGRTEALPAPEQIEQVSDQKYTCTFQDVKYGFILDLPEQTQNAPLILMLHGYGNTADGFRSTVHLEAQANPLGYAVAYVSGGTEWNSGLAAAGDPDQEFLVSLAHWLQETYGFDSAHTYAAGFSNGACMVHRLAAEASDTFSACVSVAGMMPAGIWEARQETEPVSFFQITGEKDAVVPKHSDGSAEHTQAPAIEDVLDSYVQAGGMTLSEECTAGTESTLTKYAGGNRQVWHLVIKNGSHQWQGGGADTNALIMEFLEAQK